MKLEHQGLEWMFGVPTVLCLLSENGNVILGVTPDVGLLGEANWVPHIGMYRTQC